MMTPLTDDEAIAVDELATALEERFGGVIERDAEKIARFIILREREHAPVPYYAELRERAFARAQQ